MLKIKKKDILVLSHWWGKCHRCSNIRIKEHSQAKREKTKRKPLSIRDKEIETSKHWTKGKIYNYMHVFIWIYRSSYLNLYYLPVRYFYTTIGLSKLEIKSTKITPLHKIKLISVLLVFRGWRVNCIDELISILESCTARGLVELASNIFEISKVVICVNKFQVIYPTVALNDSVLCFEVYSRVIYWSIEWKSGLRETILCGSEITYLHLIKGSKLIQRWPR